MLQGNSRFASFKRYTNSRLLVSSIGYATDTVKLYDGKNNYEILLRRIQNVLNEVVVTGSSKATRIKENPLAISLVSAKQIDQSSANNVIDAVAKNVPGFETVKTGPNVSKPFINGLGYNRVLTLYDGLRVETQQWGDEHGVPLDDYIIDKAEVIECRQFNVWLRCYCRCVKFISRPCQNILTGIPMAGTFRNTKVIMA